MSAVQKVPSHPPNDPIDKLAWYLDQAFPIPGTKYRVGWDGIIGLIPGLGEIIMLFLQAGIVLAAVIRYDVPFVIAARMVINVLIDSLIGTIPFVGDLFDFVFKANTRNIALLNEVRALRQQGVKVSTARHWAFVLMVALVLLAIIAGIVMLILAIFNFARGFLPLPETINSGSWMA